MCEKVLENLFEIDVYLRVNVISLRVSKHTLKSLICLATWGDTGNVYLRALVKLADQSQVQMEKMCECSAAKY